MEINSETVVIETIFNFIKKFKNLELDIKPQSLILDELGLDSLDIVEIGIILKRDLKLEISDEVFMHETFKTVQDVINFIEKVTSNA